MPSVVYSQRRQCAWSRRICLPARHQPFSPLPAVPEPEGRSKGYGVRERSSSAQEQKLFARACVSEKSQSVIERKMCGLRIAYTRVS